MFDFLRRALGRLFYLGPGVFPGKTPMWNLFRSAGLAPAGLVAVGGDLRPQRLLEAYCHGAFP
jgi:hypothetical protein